MAQNSRNINPIGFFADTRQLSHNREAAYGERRPHIVPLGYIPPFQIVRRLTDSNLNTIRLYRRETNTFETITVDMYSTGFQVLTFPTYKIWSYPGTVPLPLSVFNEGVYYMTITDGSGNVLTREDFCWKHQAGMSGFVKMEWFHQRNVTLPFGHINFVAPFKFWHWFDTELGKPNYPVERDVDSRKGVEYVNSIVSWKEQRFVTRGDENFMDALSLVQHMDTVVVTFLGDEINTFRVIVTPDWQERGDEALIEIEIRSDQVVVTNGDALTNFDYEAECLAVAATAVTTIVEGSTNWLGGYYVAQNGGGGLFEAGDYILATNVGVTDLYEFVSPGNYTLISLANNEIVYDADFGNYLPMKPTTHFTKPAITDIDNPLVPSTPTTKVVSGSGLPNTLVEIWGKENSLSITETLLAVGLNGDFEGAGLTVDLLNNTVIRAKFSTVNCQMFQVTSWKNINLGEGIGIGIVESTFIVE